MQFIKFHGFGNDYIVFEADEVAEVSSLNDFARAVCDRHYGAGADGITVVSRAAGGDADFAVRIFNADGSEAGLDAGLDGTLRQKRAMGRRCLRGYRSIST